MKEADSGWPLQRLHALRAIRTFHVQQRVADRRRCRISIDALSSDGPG
jgi:hypothetical protein